jgi:hypothetical protein
MAQENVEVVRRAIQAANARDVDGHAECARHHTIDAGRRV